MTERLGPSDGRFYGPSGSIFCIDEEKQDDGSVLYIPYQWMFHEQHVMPEYQAHLPSQLVKCPFYATNRYGRYRTYSTGCVLLGYAEKKNVKAFKTWNGAAKYIMRHVDDWARWQVEVEKAIGRAYDRLWGKGSWAESMAECEPGAEFDESVRARLVAVGHRITEDDRV